MKEKQRKNKQGKHLFEGMTMAAAYHNLLDLKHINMSVEISPDNTHAPLLFTSVIVFENLVAKNLSSKCVYRPERSLTMMISVKTSISTFQWRSAKERK